MSKMDSYLCAIFRRIFRLFPINQRKVVFCSYYGKGYSDNPKAIAESLLASGQHLKLVWLLQDRRDATSLPPGIRPASYWGIHRAWELSERRTGQAERPTLSANLARLCPEAD